MTINVKTIVWMLLLIGVLAVPSALANDTKRPNFVIFLTDDMGWGDAACYGHPVIKTPNLDRFAKEGLRFTNCYAACSVCSPSRSAILTGRTPYRNGVWRWIPGGSQYHLRQSEITIATLLKKKGYDTCHVGKWHLNGKFNSPEQPQPNDHGYNWWLATQNNAAPSHKNPTNFVRNGKPVGKLEGFSAVLVADEGVDWLKNHRDKDKPFFLSVWTHEPHLPIESDPKYMKLYSDEKDDGVRQHHGNITQLDDAFGRVLKALEDIGEVDNTFVFFTSDNGPEGNGVKGRTRGSTGGLRGRKRSTFEGGIRVPGVLRWPAKFKQVGLKPGSTSDEPVIGSDLFTTLCAIVDQPLPTDRTIDGANMLPALEGQSIQRDQPLYWRNHLSPKTHNVAVRIGPWKVIGNDDLSKFELYNLVDDPQEKTELSAKHPNKFAEMKAILIKQDKAVLEEGPDWWKNDKPRRGGNRNKGKVKGPKLDKGVDKTGKFDVVKGGVATKHELGVQLKSEGEAVALWKLDKPVTNCVTFTTSYQTTVNTNTRNACLVFGANDENDDLIKVGSMIGMGAHGVFQGSWANVGNLGQIQKTYDPNKLIHITVTLDVKKRTIDAVIDGSKIQAKLPDDVKSITHYGFYVKNTASVFQAVKLER